MDSPDTTTGAGSAARAPSPPAKRGCSRKLGIGCTSLAISCLVAEFVARLFIGHYVTYYEPSAPKSLIAPSDDKHLGYDLVPGAHYVAEYPEVPGASPHKLVEYEVNADGFRDEELFAKPKPSGTFRIAIVGDSFTMGVGVPSSATFAKVMEKKLAEFLPTRKIEVMNCGVYGFNTQQEVALIQDRVLAYEPDWVFICFYMNDVVPLDVHKAGRAIESDISSFLGLTFGEPRLDHIRPVEHVQWWLRQRSVLIDNLCAALEQRLRERAYDHVLRDNWGVEGSAGWAEFLTYIKLFPDLCKAHGAQAHFLLFPDLSVLGPKYPWRAQHQILRDLCTELGIKYYDLLPVIVNEAPRSLQVHVTDHHPNEKCHQLIGEKLAAGIAPVIEKELASRDAKSK